MYDLVSEGTPRVFSNWLNQTFLRIPGSINICFPFSSFTQKESIGKTCLSELAAQRDCSLLLDAFLCNLL